MATLTAQIRYSIEALMSNALDIGSVQYPLAYGVVDNLANGTGANQANQVWTDTRTLSASATENLDLAGALVDAFGTTLTFTRIKAILVFAATANTNAVQVTRPGANGAPLFMAAGDGIALTPGASFATTFPDANGIAITAGTGDLLTFTNSAAGTSVTYTVLIIGTV